MNNLDSLWNYLAAARRYGPQSTNELWVEISELRLGGNKLADLPETMAELDRALNDLAIAGKAVKSADGWVWAEPTKKQMQKQGGLFDE
jgi:hypothetical protein